MTSPVHAGEVDRFGGWQWSEPARGEHFRRCSYCGSMHPDDLAAETNARVHWADRKYGWPHKFYVDVINRDPDRLYVISSSSGNTSVGLTHYSDLTREEKRAVKRDGYLEEGRWGGKDFYYGIGTRSTHFGKVYTVHLADPDISDETKARAASMCGLLFEYLPDGRIAWRP